MGSPCRRMYSYRHIAPSMLGTEYIDCIIGHHFVHLAFTRLIYSRKEGQVPEVPLCAHTASNMTDYGDTLSYINMFASIIRL